MPRHLFGQQFFQLWTLHIGQQVGVVNAPTAHGLAVHLRGEIPGVSGDASWHRKKIEISLSLLVNGRLFLEGMLRVSSV